MLQSDALAQILFKSISFSADKLQFINIYWMLIHRTIGHSPTDPLVPGLLFAPLHSDL